MASLGDVLARLHDAYSSFTSVRGTVRLWHDPMRSSDAWNRWVQLRQQPGSVTELSPPPPIAPGGSPARVETVLRLWMSKPSRWRIEAAEAGAGPVTVVDGASWTHWGGGTAAVTNQGEEAAAQGATGVDRALVVMTDPAPVMSAFLLEPVGDATQAGRAGILVRGRPRPQAADLLWPGADELELLIDAERGVLLRSVAYVERIDYVGGEFLEVAFDEEFDPGLFRFVPPAGVRLRKLPRARINLGRRRRGGSASRALRWSDR